MFQIWWSICGLSWVKSPIVLLGGPLPFWSAVTMSGCTWLSIVFGQVIRVKLNPHQCQDLSFFFFSRSTPHCNKTINVNQLACQWFLCSGWLGTCMHKESHTYASTHTYTHTPTNTHIKALRILGYWQTAYTPLWVPMPWVKLSDTFHTGSTYTTLSPWGLHWRCPFANNSIMDTHLQCLDAHAFLNTHTRTRMHIRDHVHTME